MNSIEGFSPVIFFIYIKIITNYDKFVILGDLPSNQKFLMTDSELVPRGKGEKGL
jgi:hypothetical protein